MGGSSAGRLRLNYCILVLILWGWVVVGLWSLCVCVQVCRVYRLIVELFFLCLFLYCLLACFFSFCNFCGFCGFLRV